MPIDGVPNGPLQVEKTSDELNKHRLTTDADSAR